MVGDNERRSEVIVRDSEGERRWKINLQESQYIYRHKYDTQNSDIYVSQYSKNNWGLEVRLLLSCH